MINIHINNNCFRRVVLKSFTAKKNSPIFMARYWATEIEINLYINAHIIPKLFYDIKI